MGGGWEWVRGWPGSFLVKDKGVFVLLSHSLPAHPPELALTPTPPHQRLLGKEASCLVMEETPLGTGWWLVTSGLWLLIPPFRSPRGVRVALLEGFPYHLRGL